MADLKNERNAIDNAITDGINIADDIIPDVEKILIDLDEIGDTVRKFF